MQHSLQFRCQVRIFLRISPETSLPFRLSGASPRDRFPEMLQGLLGNMKGGFHRPTQPLFGQTDLFHAERCSMCCRRVLLVGTAEPDVGPNRDQGGPVPLFPGLLQRGGNRVDVVALLDPLDVPAERGEAGCTVFRKGQFRAAFDRDVIVGIEDNQLAQPQVPGLRSGLGRDPFLQVAIASQDVGVVLDDFVTWPIEPGRQGRLGDGHAHGIRQALPQGTGGGLDTGGLAVFRMAWGTTSPLAKPFEFLQWQVEARDMK